MQETNITPDRTDDPGRFMPTREICRDLGDISYTSLWRLIKRGEYPPLVSLGSGNVKGQLEPVHIAAKRRLLGLQVAA